MAQSPAHAALLGLLCFLMIVQPFLIKVCFPVNKSHTFCVGISNAIKYVHCLVQEALIKARVFDGAEEGSAHKI